MRVESTTFESVERITELRSVLATLSAVALSDLSEQEQDDLFFAAEEFYALTGHDFCVEPTKAVSNG